MASSLSARVTTGRQHLSPDELEFYRERVALLGQIGTAVAVFSILVQLVLAYAVDDYADPWGAGTWLLMGGALAPAAAWLICTSRDIGRTLVSAAEIGSVLTSSTAYVAVMLQLSPQHHFERLLLLALTYIAVLRTAIVPSSAARTAAMTMAMAIPLLIGTAVYYRGYAPYPADPLSATHTPTVMVLWSLVWWSTTVVICTITSRVIFGLRSEIRAAKRLGQYVLEEKIGEGGMGEVYRGSHALLKRPTAIKLVPPERAGQQTLDRFEQEVQLTARLTHPNTITVFDYGRTPAGVLFYAMELLEGATLSEVMRVSGPQPPNRVAHILASMLGALVEAHAAGLIHRDIKPNNVMLCARGASLDFVKVLDFGLAHAMDDEAPAEILGSPLYLSPESIRTPENVDARHDIYALGVVAYYLLSNHHPHAGDSVEAVCRAHLDDVPLPLSHHVTVEVPPALESWIMRCLDKDRDARPSSEVALRELTALAITPWTQDDAAAWWDAFGVYVRERQSEARTVASQRALEPR